MDYKSFQKAITDRLGSQFTITIIIVFAILNWELLFKMADTTCSIDEKIVIVTNWPFSIGAEIGYTILLLLLFPIGNYFAKVIGVLFNKILWGITEKGLGKLTKYHTDEDFQLVINDRDEAKARVEAFSTEVFELKKDNSQKQKTMEKWGKELGELRKKDEEDQLKYAKDSNKLLDKIEILEKSLGKANADVGQIGIGTANLIDAIRSIPYNNSKDARSFMGTALELFRAIDNGMIKEQANAIQGLLYDVKSP